MYKINTINSIYFNKQIMNDDDNAIHTENTDKTETEYSLMKHFEEVTFALYHSHLYTYKVFIIIYHSITISNIITTSLSAAGSLVSILTDELSIKIISAILIFLSTFFAIFQKTYTPAEKAIEHKRSGDAYLSIHYDIRYAKVFNDEDRQIYLRGIKDKVEELRKTSPSIPDDVYDKFKKKRVNTDEVDV